MLEFNPHFRWSAKECLKSPYFDEVRIIKLEKRSKFKIELDFDDLSLDQLLQKIKAESIKYKST